MRKVQFNAAEFISVYTQAAQNGEDATVVAKALGINVQAVFYRKHRLKQRGVTLPSLRDRKAGKKVAAKRTRTISLPADNGSVIATVGGVRLKFSIQVTEVPNGVA